MSILNVDKIQPIGGGSTITVDATDIQATSSTITASKFVGSGDLSVTGVSTFTGDVIINGDELFIADSIKHVGDTDTSISFPSNDTIRFNTAGSERLRITSDGFVGIDESNPKTGLTIGKLGDYNNYDTNTYYMPVGKWASAWNAVNALDSNTDYWVGFVGGYVKTGNSVNIALAPNRGNTNHQAGMYISGESTGTSSADFTLGKIVGGSATGQGTSGNVRATKSELFRITSGGYVGVSTVTPAQKLHVFGNSGTTAISLGDNGLTEPYMLLEANATNNISTLHSRSNHPLTFKVNNSERLRITSTGQLVTNNASSIDCGVGGIHLYLGAGARNDYSTSADGLIIEKDGSTGISIDPGSSGSARIYFPNESNHSIASISHDNSNGEFRIRGEDHIILSTNGNTERLRIKSNGYTGVGNFSSKPTHITDPLNVDSGIGTCNIGGNYIHLKRYSGGNTQYINAPQNNANLHISADDFLSLGVDHSSSMYSMGTEAIRIISNGKVLIPGTQTQSDQTGKLDIYHTAPDEIDSPHIRLWGPTNQDARIEFGSETNAGEGGYIMYNDSDEGLYIGSRMATYGEVSICTGMNDGSPTSNIRLRVDSVGRVTKPNTVAFHAIHNGNQSLSSGDTITTWSTSNTHRCHAQGGATISAGGVFTAPVTGVYVFHAQFLLQDTNGTNGIHLFWKKNGSTFSYFNTRHNGATIGYGNYMPLCGQTTMHLDANEDCRIGISFSGSGCSVYGSDGNWGFWDGYLLG